MIRNKLNSIIAFTQLHLKIRYFFLFTKQSILMAQKISCSNNPNLFWQILLLRPRVKDFETWVFCTPRGSPLTLR